MTKNNEDHLNHMIDDISKEIEVKMEKKAKL